MYDSNNNEKGLVFIGVLFINCVQMYTPPFNVRA